MCQTVKKKKRKKKCTPKAAIHHRPVLPFVVVVLLVACGCGCRARHCHSSLLVAVVCCVLCVLPVVCCAFAICSQIRLDQVSPTPIAQKTKRKRRYFRHDHHGTVMHHPQLATLLLFGGVFSNFCNATPPWSLCDNTGIQIYVSKQSDT